jgi:hypothetical protein
VREHGVHRFGFLQAQDVGLGNLGQTLGQADPEADRVDVPGGDLQGVWASGYGEAKGVVGKGTPYSTECASARRVVSP